MHRTIFTDADNNSKQSYGMSKKLWLRQEETLFWKAVTIGRTLILTSGLQMSQN